MQVNIFVMSVTDSLHMLFLTIQTLSHLMSTPIIYTPNEIERIEFATKLIKSNCDSKSKSYWERHVNNNNLPSDIKNGAKYCYDKCSRGNFSCKENEAITSKFAIYVIENSIRIVTRQDEI